MPMTPRLLGPPPDIAGVATSIAAFVGYTAQGVDNRAEKITSVADFARLFGGLAADSALSYGVEQFFANGGTDAYAVRVAGAQGGLPGTADLIGDRAASTGLYALDKVDLFNLLSIPDATRAASGNPHALDPAVDPNSVYAAAIDYCKSRRAMLLVDPPPEVNDAATALDWKTGKLAAHDANGAAFFPRLVLADALDGGRLRRFAPSPLVAGLYARSDAARGVWTAPAGPDLPLVGVQDLACVLTELQASALNAVALNCFRKMPVYGPLLWGSRTLAGADAEGSEWKYVPIRRLALYLEESLDRGTRWAQFEPNGNALWTALRSSVGAFMQGLYKKGGLSGAKSNDAYFVACDGTTTTRNDIDQGIVNIVVGFAPLRPAEFIVLRIRQKAGPPP